MYYSKYFGQKNIHSHFKKAMDVLI